jgi:XTP/dITP diphosphohydrolase
MTALLIATRNAHKAREIERILGADYQCLTLNDFPGAPGVVEDGATFAANAAKKASALADWFAATPESPVAGIPIWNREAVRGSLKRSPRRGDPTLPAPAILDPTRSPANAPFYILADDSGLEVDALDGAPGVHSARFAALDSGGADNSPDGANNAKLLRLLAGVPAARRTARFRCVLALCGPGMPSVAQPVFFEGACEGSIGFEPAGGGGFGYDPLFIPEGCAQSFARLGEAVKNSLSHRARALEKLRQFLAQPQSSRRGCSGGL